MTTEDIRSENVWIEKRPHETKFKSNILYIKCIGEREFRKHILYNVSLNAREQITWKGKEIHLKYMCIYSKLSGFTRIWPRGFYSAVNFKLTLKGSQGKLLLMKMCKSAYNPRINN
jgi:hypothetical protein